MFITAEDIADRLLPKAWQLKFSSVELIGEAGTFGYIVVDNMFSIRVRIQNEEKILDELERFMLNMNSLLGEAFSRKIDMAP